MFNQASSLGILFALLNSFINELHAKMSQILTIFCSKSNLCSIRQVLLVYFLLCSIVTSHVAWKMSFMRKWVRFWPYFARNLIYVQSGKFCWYSVCLTRKPNRNSMKNELHAKMSQVPTIFPSKSDSSSMRQVLLV